MPSYLVGGFLSPAVFFCALTAFVLPFIWQKRLANKIPKPKTGVPFVGDILEYLRDPLFFMKRATLECGQIFRANMPASRAVHLGGPELNKFFLYTREDTWSFNASTEVLLSKILNPSYFPVQSQMINSVNRGVNRNIALDHCARVTAEESAKLLQELASTGEFKIFEQMSILAFRAIVLLFMGEDFYQKHCSEIYSLLARMEVDARHPLSILLPDWVPHAPARRLWAARDRMVEIFRDRLAAREHDHDKWEDALDYVSFAMKDKATVDKTHLLPTHLTILIFAAHANIAVNVAWSIIELARNPEKLCQLRESLSDCPDIHKSPFLAACLKETLRRYSGLHMLRCARRPVKLPNSDVVVPRDANILICPYITHHDPAVYPEPYDWIPERWNDGLIEKANTPKGVSFVGFGAGPHKCPGENVANTIIREVIATVVRNYEIDWGSGGPPLDFADLNFTKIGGAWLKGDAFMQLQRRTSQ